MKKYYSEYSKFHVAIDCIIFGFDKDKLKLLLIKRKFEPEIGKWSLMGGFVEENESLDDAVKRILFKLTGLENIIMEQLFTYGEIDRDPGERVISVAYFAVIKTDDYTNKLGSKYGAKWEELTYIPDLIFDHNLMVKKALKRLRRSAKYQPIGFEILPEKFTIPQLQKLYEAIYQKELDKRNFRKKILSMNLLLKLDEKEKKYSRKGAYYYKFNKEKYDDLISKGYNFEI